MFEYLCNSRAFNIKLGQFISHKVIHKTVNGVKSLRTELELNELDRINLAYEFYNSIHHSYLEGYSSKEVIIDDIAFFIDKQIPKSFIKWRDKEHDLSPNKITRSIESTNLIYHFKINNK